MNQQQWFYANQGKQLGPYPLEQLQHFITDGTLLPTDLVWTEGMPQWTPAGQLPILFPNKRAAADAIVLSYPSGAEIGPVEYAGFWVRCAAYMIDVLILMIPLVIAGLLIPFFGGLIAIWLYFSLMESSQVQATLGKMALGLRVTDLQGARIGFGRATGRLFGKIISSMILDIGFMMAGWTEKKQALHDMMADTLVVRK